MGVHVSGCGCACGCACMGVHVWVCMCECMCRAEKLRECSCWTGWECMHTYIRVNENTNAMCLSIKHQDQRTPYSSCVHFITQCVHHARIERVCVVNMYVRVHVYLCVQCGVHVCVVCAVWCACVCVVVVCRYGVHVCV